MRALAHLRVAAAQAFLIGIEPMTRIRARWLLLFIWRRGTVWEVDSGSERYLCHILSHIVISFYLTHWIPLLTFLANLLYREEGP
jgi:hypothetical protein